MRCAVQVGFFLVRPCDEPAVNYCSRCNQPACKAHVRPIASMLPGAPPQVICLTCYNRDRSSGTSDHDRYNDSSSSSSSSSSSGTTPDQFTPAGGEFAGGGASGGWVPAAPMSDSTSDTGDANSSVGFSDPVAASGLTAEEAAAFDEISDFDNDSSRADAYDS